MIRDAVYALRQLRKAPGFTAVAVLTLALGIGANTAIFSVISSTLLRPLAYPESDRIVQLSSETPASQLSSHVTGPELKQWREHASLFLNIAGIWDRYPTNLLGGDHAERVYCALVSANYLDVLGVRPLLGSNFSPSQDAKNGDTSVAVLSYECWRARFGGDPAVLGRIVDLGGWKCRVIGVLPPRALPNSKLDVLMPLVLGSMPWEMVPDTFWVGAVARLKPGVTPSQGEAELNALSRELHSRIFPPFKDKLHTHVQLLQVQLSAEAKPVLLILGAAVALVLLIVCANLASLLMSRAETRQREMAIRAALGAGRSRLICLGLAESGVLAALGGTVGVLLAGALIAATTKFASQALPLVMQPSIDWRVLMFSVVLSLAAVIVFGVVPAWRAGQASPNTGLKEAFRGSTAAGRARTQSYFVVLQIALTVMLLITVGLFLRSLRRIVSSDLGFERQGALVCDWSVTIGSFYRDETGRDDDDQQRAFDRILRFLREVVARIEALPEVDSAGTVTTLPLAGDSWGTHVGLPDRPAEEDRSAALDYVGHNYFRAMGMRLLKGRLFAEAEDVPGGPHVIVVNEEFVRELMPGQDPVGRHVRLNNAEWTVIGVVSSVRNERLDVAPPSHVYGVQAINPVTIAFVVRTRTEPLLLQEKVRHIVASVDPDQAVANFRTLEQAVDHALQERKLSLLLLTGFAVVALGLACIGIFGLTAYAVGQRRKEFSIRIALGAQNSDVIRLGARQGVLLAVVGIAVGLVGATASARLVSSRLYEVSSIDPLVFTIVSLLLGSAAISAALIPAWRATRASPIDALRGE